MATRTNQQQRTTEPISEEPMEGASLQPPVLMIIIGVIEIGWSIFCNFQQVSTSTEAFYVSIASAATLGTDRSAAHLLTMQPQLHMMALVIAFSIQIFMVSNAQPISVVWHRLRSIHVAENSGKQNIISAARDVSMHLSLRQWIALAAFAGDVIGDIRYGMLTTGDGFSIFFWTVFLSASSTILLLDGAQRIWGAIQAWRLFQAAYHAQQSKGGE